MSTRDKDAGSRPSPSLPRSTWCHGGQLTRPPQRGFVLRATRLAALAMHSPPHTHTPSDGRNPPCTTGVLPCVWRYKQGDVVLDKCYDDLAGVAVQNSLTNGWSGSLLFARQRSGPYVCKRGGCFDLTRRVPVFVFWFPRHSTHADTARLVAAAAAAAAAKHMQSRWLPTHPSCAGSCFH